jgi:hypothetical protein
MHDDEMPVMKSVESERRERAAHFSAMEQVNGVTIEASWDPGYGEITFYFPDIELGSEAAVKYRIDDSTMRVSKDDAVAKGLYEQAKAIAAGMKKPDAYALYIAVKKLRDGKPPEQGKGSEAEARHRRGLEDYAKADQLRRKMEAERKAGKGAQ